MPVQILPVKSERRVKRSLQEQIIIDKNAILYFRDSVLAVSQTNTIHTLPSPHDHTPPLLSTVIHMQVVVNETLVKYSFKNIDTLHTYSVYKGIESFHSQPDVLQSFNGRGSYCMFTIDL